MTDNGARAALSFDPLDARLQERVSHYGLQTQDDVWAAQGDDAGLWTFVKVNPLSRAKALRVTGGKVVELPVWVDRALTLAYSRGFRDGVEELRALGETRRALAAHRLEAEAEALLGLAAAIREGK